MKENTISQAEAPASPPLQRQTRLPHRILLVEDDDDIRRLNAEVLVGSGFHVDAAEDGAVAWQALECQNYDLLVTDNEMPKVTGVELLKKLHAVRRALPVIMATGVFPMEAFTHSPWLQPAAVLIKPYTTEEFLGTVRDVLRVNVSAREPGTATSKIQSQPPIFGWKL